MAMLFPYIMIRSFCSDRKTLLKVIWMMTVLGAIVAFFNLIEFRMFTNYFDQILRKIWPRYVVWDTGMVMGRMGFKRAFGPFSHPIIAGYVFSLIAPLAIWSYFQGLYRNKYMGRIIVFLNIMGIFVAISRAPIIGFLLGLAIIYYGWSNKKMTMAIIFSVVLGIIVVGSLPKIISYVSVTRATAKTTDQRNVAYRKEMWEAYIDIVKERPYIGWGRFTVPTIRGMDSIDSEYLSVALASGVIALSFYLIFLIGMLIRLFRSAQMKKHDDPMARLAWCLIAGWVSAIFSLGTVYSGAQSIHYMFMLGGVGQVIILGAVKEWALTKESTKELSVLGRGFGFARVI
jgi:O-antigen ligase